MSHPILQLSSLSKTFPGQIALNQVDLEVRSGSIHALLGHNGSGKSTLIKLLSGFEKPDWGYQACLNNQLTDLWEDRLRNRHQIRIVHQDLGLVPTLNAIENLALGRGYHTGLLGSIHWEHEALRAQELLRGLGILPDVRKPVGLLSRAEQTYVAIGRALQNWDDYTKGLLILDEP
ncbi:MAG: ATP-binding cassette domain-containing protein, partial [SAR324 cluster bacterium]|nr:ATP-binding cassette domain-containing protein [SAR324 cluster bacterium]